MLPKKPTPRVATSPDSHQTFVGRKELPCQEDRSNELHCEGSVENPKILFGRSHAVRWTLKVNTCAGGA